MMTYYKLGRALPLLADLTLNIIHRIATTEAQAKAYQVAHYQKTGELLRIEPIPSRGYGVMFKIEKGGLSAQGLLTVEKTEKQARNNVHHLEQVFPFFVVDVLPLEDMRLTQYFLGGKE